MKHIIKRNPRLYDAAKGLYRRFSAKEDVVYRFFNQYSIAHGRRVNFIQVGANDGLRWDPVREFIIRDEWHGLLVEPLPSVFELLKDNYRYLGSRDLVFVNAAVTPLAINDLSFWTFQGEFLNTLGVDQRIIWLQKSSFNKKHVEDWVCRNQQGVEILKQINIPCVTLSDLVTVHWNGSKVDLLVIDAEGHDAEIIRSIDFGKLQPDTIFFESHNLGADKEGVYGFLGNQNYQIVEMGGDSVAERKA